MITLGLERDFCGENDKRYFYSSLTQNCTHRRPQKNRNVLIKNHLVHHNLKCCGFFFFNLMSNNIFIIFVVRQKTESETDEMREKNRH